MDGTRAWEWWSQKDEHRASQLVAYHRARGDSVRVQGDAIYNDLVTTRVPAATLAPLGLCCETDAHLTWVGDDVSRVFGLLVDGDDLLALLVGLADAWVLLDLWSATGTRTLGRSSGAPRGHSLPGARQELRFQRTERVDVACGRRRFLCLGGNPPIPAYLPSGKRNMNEYRFLPLLFASLRPLPSLDVMATPQNSQTILCITKRQNVFHPRYDVGLELFIIWWNGPFCPHQLALGVHVFIKRGWSGWMLMPTWPTEHCYQRALGYCRKYKQIAPGARCFLPGSLDYKKSNGPCPFGLTAFYMTPRK